MHVSTSTLAHRPDSQEPPSIGARLVSTDGRALPLSSTKLSTEAGGGLARSVLTQRFVNAHDAPLRVTYQLPLPADGAVSGFAFTIGARRVVGRIARRADARRAFEDAILAGRTAALLDEERSSVFTEELGNVPPGASIEVEVSVDQPLRWLAEGAWELRFATVVGPRYLGAHVVDAERIATDVADGTLGARVSLELSIGDDVIDVGSTSHALAVGDGGRRVSLAAEAELDRDLVIAWRVRADEIAGRLVVTEHGGKRYGLLTIVPPRVKVRPRPRDLVILIDASGSMDGAPLTQATRIASALVSSLGEDDRLELIAFADRPSPMTAAPMPATESSKRTALAWLAALRASGGTQMREGILAALRPARDDAERQVVLITDGWIGFEREVIRALVDALPERTRLHTVGIGSAPNRTLTRSAARAAGGLEVIVGLGEDVERATTRLLARTEGPVLTRLALSSEVEEVAQRRLPELYAGCPALVPVMLASDARRVRVRGETADGPFSMEVEISAGEAPRAVAALFGRERIEDLETSHAVHAEAEIDRQIEALGLELGIATRLTSWVAIDEEVSVRPGTEEERVVQPQALPHGTSIGGLGLRRASEISVDELLDLCDVPSAPPLARTLDESIERPKKSVIFMGGIGRGGPPPPRSEGSVRRRSAKSKGEREKERRLEPLRLHGPISVRDLAARLERSVAAVITALVGLGELRAAITTTLSLDLATKVAHRYGHDVEILHARATVIAIEPDGAVLATIMTGELRDGARARALRAAASLGEGTLDGIERVDATKQRVKRPWCALSVGDVLECLEVRLARRG